ncbi:MAG: hypothetical protein KJO35_00715, partial [Gammaproteobacteria bacterium]|nr:hypothetical protein [Gammaproteobacteria bacterium]
MKQNINLFQPAAGVEAGRLSARQMLLGWSVALVLLTVSQAWLEQRNRSLADQGQSVQARLQQGEDQLNSQMAARVAGTDKQLELALNEALRELDLRETILALVSGNGAGDLDGFSAQLRSLARQHVRGVWLTRVSVQAPGSQTTLEGRALSPE